MQELILKLPNEFIFDNPIIIIDALKKEKEQIIDAYYGNIDGVYGYREEGQEYYNQTFNQNK